MTIARSNPVGNGGPIDGAAVLQLQADVATMRGDIADIKQALVLLPRALDKLEHVINQGDRLIEATSGPDGVPAWQAAIGALGDIAARLDITQARLQALDGRLASLALRTHQTGRLVRVALALIGAAKFSNLIAWWRRRE